MAGDTGSGLKKKIPIEIKLLLKVLIQMTIH